MMTSVEIMYWHDIPVSVRARAGRDRYTVQLNPRFQVAVDKAAMEAGLTGSDAYTDQFHWSAAGTRVGSPAEVARAVAADLEARFSKIDWRRTADALRQSR